MVAHDPKSLIRIGRIFRPHGVRGEVKIVPETDEPERFSDLEQLFVGENASEAESFVLETVKYQPVKRGVSVIVKLAGVDSREAADALRKSVIYAKEEDLPALEEGEIFLHDLIGLNVVTEEGESVGVVADVLEMPAQLVYVVQRKNATDVMIPDVSEIVLDVDLEDEKLVIRPIEGLLD